MSAVQKVAAAPSWRVELMRCGFATTYDVVRGQGLTMEHAKVRNEALGMDLCAAFPDQADAQRHADGLNEAISTQSYGMIASIKNASGR